LGLAVFPRFVDYFDNFVAFGVQSDAHRRLYGRATRHFVLRRTLKRVGVAVAVPTRFFDVKAHGDRPRLGRHSCSRDNGAVPEVAIQVIPGWIAASFRQHFRPVEGDACQIFGRATHVASQSLSLHRVANPWADRNCPFDDFRVSLVLGLAVFPRFVDYFDNFSAAIEGSRLGGRRLGGRRLGGRRGRFLLAARRAIVEKRSRTIATRGDSIRARALAVLVTAAMVYRAPVYTS